MRTGTAPSIFDNAITLRTAAELDARRAFPVFTNAISGTKIEHVPMESRFPDTPADRICAQRRIFPVFIPDILA
ncbi:MAG: hypothetical protein WDM86_03265 [Rhizomicrobium sp.]